MRITCLAVLIALVLSSVVQAVVVDGTPIRPVTTYSIVARDPATGQLGVAVQSHWFSVGSVVPWVKAGVGAVATQSLTDVTYGPLGLELMQSGKTAEQALAGLVATDDHPEWRQVGMIDANGNRAVHTGRQCIREAGHVAGDNFIVMANLMEKNTVWEAMADAFRSSPGDLAERMLAALEAAQGEGGDIRGRQSAAMIVVRGTSTGADYKDRLIDLRVEDHPTPLRELRRLVTLNRAYLLMNEGDEKMVARDTQGAMEAYNGAMELAPDVTEIKYWAALTMFADGLEREALEIFTEVFAREPLWVEVTRRLPAAGLLINDAGELDRILSVAPE
ncbi:MAG: DUF1028 domain-containing protein [Candidatus Latescibacterota bacterium]|nr:MAG: DUF1028 domain-containing protein [Candidatus Latescibacterota bacterium]